MMKNKRIIVLWATWLTVTAIWLYCVWGCSLRLLWRDMKTGFQFTTEREYKILILSIVLLAMLSICNLVLKTGSLVLLWDICVGGRKIEINTCKLPYKHFTILIGISFFMLLMSMHLRDVITLRGGDQLENISVAHALGIIDDKTYTNSKDALLHNYDLGHRTFEVDFSITSDRQVVCLHDWGYAVLMLGEREEEILSKDEFESCLLYKKYEPVSVQELLLFMYEHKDVWIVTDSKEVEPELVTLEFSYIVDTAKSLGIEEVLNRIAVQIYNQEMYNVVCEVYEFPSFIFTLYMYWDGDIKSFPEICRFCAGNNISIVTMWYYWATPEVMEIAKDYGIEVYVHTVNDTEDVEKLKSMGVKGFYTDFLTPEIIESIEP